MGPAKKYIKTTHYIEALAPNVPNVPKRNRCKAKAVSIHSGGLTIAQYVCPKSVLCDVCIVCIVCDVCFALCVGMFCVMCWYGHYGCNLFYLCDDWLYLSVVQRVACHG